MNKDTNRLHSSLCGFHAVVKSGGPVAQLPSKENVSTTPFLMDLHDDLCISYEALVPSFDTT